MDYLLHIVILICVYSAVALSLDLLVGHMFVFSVAQASFFALGAYVSALAAVEGRLPFWAGAALGMTLSVGVSFVLSLSSLRVRDDYFAIVTFGFGIVVFNVLNNWGSVTRGPLGIPGIPAPAIFGIAVNTRLRFLLLAALFTLVAFVIVQLIVTSPFGRVLHGIREDEVFVKALGKNTLRFKVIAFAVSAALAASAGTLYAHYVTFIDPSSFTVMESILMISMVIIGGAGSRWGPVLGAAVLVALPEILRFVGLPSAVAANFRQVFYGGLLTIMILLRPRGLLGGYGFGR